MKKVLMCQYDSHFSTDFRFIKKLLNIMAVWFQKGDL